MPATPVLSPPAMTDEMPRKRFTRSEVECLIESGFFNGQRFELIDGDLIDKMGQKPPHSYAIQLVQIWLTSFLNINLLRVQLPIEAKGADRERCLPGPDLAVLRAWSTDYQHRQPGGDELALCVEVADTTVAFDLSRKAELYAHAGVLEYWVLDLPRRMLVVHRQTDGTRYRQIHLHTEDEKVSMEGRSELITAGDLLPTPEA